MKDQLEPIDGKSLRELAAVYLKCQFHEVDDAIIQFLGSRYNNLSLKRT